MTRPTVDQITEVLHRLDNAAGWIGEGDQLVRDLLAWIEGRNTEIAAWALSLCPGCGVAPTRTHAPDNTP